MCAITGSFDKQKLKELYKLNSYRGELSHSLSSFKTNEFDQLDLMMSIRGAGKIPEYLIDNLSNDESLYYLAHSQAPTTESKNIHPASLDGAMLWHNGIIKQGAIPHGCWDTAWLLEHILDYGWSTLSKVDGTFACVMYLEKELYVFRNEISPLFIDKNLSLTSTKTENFKSINPNIVYKMNLLTKVLEEEAHFETLENPYYIPEL